MARLTKILFQSHRLFTWRRPQNVENKLTTICVSCNVNLKQEEEDNKGQRLPKNCNFSFGTLTMFVVLVRQCMIVERPQKQMTSGYITNEERIRQLNFLPFFSRVVFMFEADWVTNGPFTLHGYTAGHRRVCPLLVDTDRNRQKRPRQYSNFQKHTFCCRDDH